MYVYSMVDIFVLTIVFLFEINVAYDVRNIMNNVIRMSDERLFEGL